MNTLTTTERRHEQVRQPQRLAHPEQLPLRRLGLADRAALHVGIALIRWSRRPSLPRDERRANGLELALLQREQLRLQRDVRRALDRAQTERDLRTLYQR